MIKQLFSLAAATLMASALAASPAVDGTTGATAPAAASSRTLTLNASKAGAAIQPTMYGIFFEDINYGADGGLYADLVANRSFEFPQSLMCWTTFGNVAIADAQPAFPRNPHYAVLTGAGHREKASGLENHGFFGMGLRQGMTYDFSAWVRLHNGAKASKLQVELIASDDVATDKQTVDVTANAWTKVTVRLTSKVTDQKGFLRVVLAGKDAVDIDHISLFPSDNWHGLRADLVKDLEDLHPGVFRFPGGCIVEGTDLNTRYQWKNSIGAVENRPLNENRWNYTFPHRRYPTYYQSYGLGFYEFFLLSEKIGADPLPVLSCGQACQFQNDDKDPKAHVSGADLQPYIDDALDLIEFANGAVTTKWGKVRADLGHPEPFHLKQIGIGNEQWGPLYPERLQEFVKQIRARYPDIKVCGTSGPSASGKDFDYGWEQMRKLKVDLVDEHYYMKPQWFLDNAARYDKYPRKGPKVFAGEYAAHGEGEFNNWEAALSEAAFMTGLERNADVVHQSTYAPLFAHVEGWQWKPDLIWFDNLRSLRSANWYVQMLYGTNKGTNVLSLTEGGKALEGAGSLYGTACVDRPAKALILKLANTADKPQTVTVALKGAAKATGVKGNLTFSVTTLTAPLKAENTLANPNAVVPTTSSVESKGSVLTLTLPAHSFVVVRSK